MLNKLLTIGAIGLLLTGGVGLGLQTPVMAGPAQPYLDASVYFEQNATDEDVEVVFKVGGGDVGLAKLTVVGPDGRTVIDFTAPDASTLGIRKFMFESPEPDAESLKSAYPEGIYSFTGATAAGARLSMKAILNHTLPTTATFLHPKPENGVVSANDLEIAWAPIKNLEAYIIEIEHEEQKNLNMTVRLPGSETTFPVPNGFLQSGTEYKLSIGTVTEDGNISFVETTFTTTGKEGEE